MPINTFSDGEKLDSVRGKLNSAIQKANQSLIKTDADKVYFSKDGGGILKRGGIDLTPAVSSVRARLTDNALQYDKTVDIVKVDDGTNPVIEIGSHEGQLNLNSSIIPRVDLGSNDYAIVVDNHEDATKNYARKGDGSWVDISTLGLGNGSGMTEAQGDARYLMKNGGGKLVSSYIDLDQDAGIRVVMTDDNDQDRGLADVIGVTDGMNGNIEIGSYKEGLILNAKDKIKSYSHSTQRTTNVVTDDMTNSKKNYVRSGTGTWVDIQPLLDAITGGGDGTAPDLSSYLTKDEASHIYLSQLLANSTFVTNAAADAKYDTKPTGMKDGFLYARATNGYHPLPEIRKPVGVMHVDNSGTVTGQISDSYAINILSIENASYSYQMNFTPKDGDIFVLINDGEKPDHNLNWALPDGTNIKGFHSFNLTAGYELWTKYVESSKEFIVFRENLSQIRGSFENTHSNQGETKEGTITRIVTKGTNADYDVQDGTLTLDLTPVNTDVGMTEAQADAKYVGKQGNQAINGELSVSVPNGVFSVRDNTDKVAIGLLHKDSITGSPAMIQTDREATLFDGRGDNILTTRYVPMPPESGDANQGNYVLKVASGAGQYATWVKQTATRGITKATADTNYLKKTDASLTYVSKADADNLYVHQSDYHNPALPDFKPASDGNYALAKSGDNNYWVKLPNPQPPKNDQPIQGIAISSGDDDDSLQDCKEIDFNPIYFKTKSIAGKPNAITVSLHKSLTQSTLSLGYTSFFDRYSKFVGHWNDARGTAKSRIYPTDVHILTGENAFIEVNPITKMFSLNPFDNVLGSVNGVSEYMTSFTVNFKGKSKDTNSVTAYLWDNDEGDFVRTSTGAYMAVQTTYNKGQEMQPLQATGVISVPTTRNLSWHIQASKPELLEIAPLDVSGSGIMFQALTKNFKTGLALMEYMLMTRTDIKFTSIHLDKVIGSSRLAIESLSTDPIQTNARTHMQYPDNFQIDTTLPCAVYREGDAICIRETDKQFSLQNRNFFTQYDLGFRLDKKQTTLLRDKEVTMKASILSKDRDHWWRAYAWTKDTPVPQQIITGLNEQTYDVVPLDGWVEVKTGMVSYDSRDSYRDISFTAQVPSDANGFAIVLMTSKERGTNAKSWFKNMTLEIPKPYTFYNIIIASNQIDPLHLSSFMALTKTFMPEDLGRNFHSLTAVTEPISVGDIKSNSGLRCSVTRDVPVGNEFGENTTAQSMLFKEGGLIKVQTSVYVRASEGLEKGRTASFSLKLVRYYKENGKWKHEDVEGSERSSSVTGGDPVIHYQPFNPVEINIGAGDALALVGTGSGSGNIELVSEGFNPCLQNRFWLVD